MQFLDSYKSSKNVKISARFWTLKNFQIWPNFFAKSAHFFPKTEVFLLNPAIRFPPPGGARCCPCEACQFAFWQPFCHMLPDWRFHRGRQQFAALRRYYFRIGPHIEFSCRPPVAQTSRAAAFGRTRQAPCRKRNRGPADFGHRLAISGSVSFCTLKCQDFTGSYM